MALRNRKQIPVCASCHNKIHNGEYDGRNLKSYIISNPTLMDNRIVHVESFIKPGDVEHNAKELEEKGWRIVNSP